MAKILITGGTGLIGKHLTKLLEAKEYEVAILSRSPKKKNQYKWDITSDYIDEKALKNTEYIIHLAGAGIADKRWTEDRKKTLIDSRVASINLLFKKVTELKIPLKGFISASGIGYYGAVTTNTVFTEKDNPHNDFIAKVCMLWENATNQFKTINITTTILRTGVVLAKNDSALQKINTPLFLSALGSGKQYFPWIHIDDLCNLYLKAIEDNNFNGIFNAIAPEHQTNQSFTNTLGKTIKKTVLPFNIPSFALKLILGNMSKILLEGSRISAEKTQKVYDFTYPNLASALKNIYKIPLVIYQ